MGVLAWEAKLDLVWCVVDFAYDDALGFLEEDVVDHQDVDGDGEW